MERNFSSLINFTDSGEKKFIRFLKMLQKTFTSKVKYCIMLYSETSMFI